MGVPPGWPDPAVVSGGGSDAGSIAAMAILAAALLGIYLAVRLSDPGRTRAVGDAQTRVGGEGRERLPVS